MTEHTSTPDPQDIVNKALESDGLEIEEDDCTWRVICEECGVVEFDVLERSWFNLRVAAEWYAGYHGGKHHGDSEFQYGMALPESYIDKYEF